MEDRFEPTLDDALNTFVQENEQPTSGNVQEWVERYPQFRKDLVEFAAVWAEQLVLRAAEEIGVETERVLVDRAMSHALNLAYNREVEALEQTTSDAPVRSLTEDAQGADTKPRELAKEFGLDLGLLSKLNNRQIQPWTIPAELVRMLADRLNKTVTAIKIYFSGTAQATTKKAYLSRGKPTGAAQQSFADAVRTSSLSDEEKARWLDKGTVEET